MGLFFFYIVVGIVSFLTLFLDSFMKADSIYLFSYLVTPFELVLGFYLFLASGILLFFRNKPHLFQKKQTLYGQSALHLLVSFSLIALSQYTFCTFFTFFYLLMLFDFKQKKISDFLFLSYLLLIHYALVLAFTSDLLFLYFLNLFAVVWFFMREKREVLTSELLVCGVCVAILFFIYYSFEVFIYDIYIWLDVVDVAIFVQSEILYVLSFLHIFLFIALHANWAIIKKKI